MESKKESFKKYLVESPLGLSYNGRFFFWGENFNTFTLSLYRADRFLTLAIDVLLILCGVLGLVPLVLLFLYGWTPLFALFFLSLFLDCYFVSRLIRRKDLHQLSRGVHHSQENFAPFFEKDAFWNILQGFLFAKKYGHSVVTPLHLFATLLSSRLLTLILLRANIPKKKLFESIGEVLKKYPRDTQLPAFSRETHEVLLASLWRALERKADSISLVDLFVGVTLENEEVAEIFYGLGVEARELKHIIHWIQLEDELLKRWKYFRHRARFKPASNMNRSMTAVATPFLDTMSSDLTLLAKFGRLEFTVGRTEEIDELFRLIESGEKSVVLVGPTGVGKDAIVSALAERMVAEDVPKELADKRLVSLSLERLLAGASPEEAQGRLLTIVEEVRRAGNIILVISQIENSMGIRVGETGGLDLSEILARPISLRECIVIATTTPENYTQTIEGTLLGDVLEKIRVDEPDKDAAIQMIQSKIPRIEYEYKVFFSIGALLATIDLSARYIHDNYLPEKAIRVLEEVAVLVAKERGEKAIVGSDDVEKLLSAKTRIPLHRATKKESEILLHLEEEIHRSIIDQNEAVQAVSRSIRRARAELRDEKRPIVNLLFLGPTGVGKTELSKTVARIYFGGETEMVRLDMSEYQDPTSVYRMIGAPPGSPNAERGGYLTEAVRKNPFGLLLLDEIEKAHPDILNIFLQVMDDGRLTDNQGRTIDFTNLMIIATSNAGTQFIQDELRKGETIETIETRLMNEVLKQYFRPEFLNRFDGIVVFKPLSMEDVQEITKLFLKKVALRLENQGIHFTYSPKAVSEVAKAGFHPEFGARPLRRVIQEHVDDELAKLILSGGLERKDTIVLEGLSNIQVKKAVI